MLRFAGILTTMLVAGSVAVGDEGTKDATKAGDPLHPHFKMVTTLGDIVLELDAEKAPVTALNFAQYAEDKFYEGTIFHRVIGNFMIQAGGFTIDGKKTEGLRDGILNEWQNGLKNVRGSISMARLGGQPDSGSSQFFISVVDNPFLDQQQRDGAAYAVFGKVVEGMDVVDRIKDLEVGSHDKIPGGKVPKEPVVIESVKLIGDFDRTKAEEAAKAAGEKVAAAQAAAEEAEKKAKAAAKEAANKAKEAANKAKEEGLKVMREHVTKLETETGKKAVFTNSGMAYLILEEGEGDLPKPTDTVKVHYSGWLLDGTKFDSSYDRGKPATFALNRVIKGWTEGVGLMKVGSKHKLVIPADLAYGERAQRSIPPNSTLVFDVELLEIVGK